MPSIDISEKDDPNATVTQPVIGIIYPPPEVRNIVDKTASFVARNGPEFEARIRQNELGNPKFNFLNPGDPYHAYYQHRVKDIREGKADQSQLQPKAQSTLVQQKQQEILKQVAEQPFIPKDPPPEFEFLADPPSISALDLDIVKLTAQFVARNGRTFLTNLMNREQRNFQFDFLRPQHSLFVYFTVLLKQYTKVLLPPKDMMSKLKDESESMTKILEQVKYRAEWIKYQEQQKQKEEEALEKERIAYAQIDWHDFVVVETVDYQPHETGNFPAPTTPDEVGARVLMQERLEDGEENEMQMESEGEEEDQERQEEEEQEDEDLAAMEDLTIDKGAKDNTQVQDMEEDSSSDDETDKSVRPPSHQMTAKISKTQTSIKDITSQPVPIPPTLDKVVIKKGYDPKQVTKKITIAPTDEYLISPINGERIPVSKVQEHMRIGLLDPRWVEQRDRQIQEKMNQETVYAAGAAIEASLKQLAERRTDIFGVGDEETAIGKKIGEEDKKKDDKVTWDGHTSSVEAATRAARANITLEDQIHQIHKVKGLLPDEEKEKIGPKPAIGRRTTQNSASTQDSKIVKQALPLSKQTGTVAKAAPTPPKAVPPKPNPPPPPPPQQPLTMAPLPPAGMIPQNPMMMMAPIRQPMMGFPVPGPPGMAPPGMAPPGLAPPGLPMPPATFIAPPGTVPEPPGAGLKHPAGTGLEDDDPTPMKKMRTEETLIPESEFLARHKNKPVMVKVLVPNTQEKPEWKLNGQLISLVLPLTDSVAVVKSKVHEDTGMPPGKQKIHWEGMFLKDSNSLAYYNILPGTVLQLQIKERGGRKK
ncbi:UNVERIFIED_CONTAM: hypothetical protein PYX00_008785 [Menopon gallinae]|uniref:Splicing factor 3A subunit 1 n=1 Tax=Menopon gallinae TaxID=328185 RepID=A0AAW2HPL8_9NEOP